MIGDGRVDRASRFDPQPCFEDRRVRTPFGADAVDHELIIERNDIRAADPGHGRYDPDPMQSAAERDAAAIPRTTAGCDPSSHLGLLPEVLPEPWLAFSEERGSSPFVVGPHRACRHRHDDAAVRMDDDAQHPGAR